MKATTKKLPNTFPNNKTLVSFKVDKKLKRDVEEILDEIGINLSTMFNVYMKRVVKYRAVETGLERVMVNSLDELEDKLKKALKSKEVPLEKSSIFKKLKFD